MAQNQVGVVAVLAVAFFGGCRPEPVDEIRPGTSQQQAEVETIEIEPGSWPWWRGSNRDSVVTENVVSFDWKSQPNIAWSVKFQGSGHSSPIVLGDRVLLTTADVKTEVKSLVCYSTQSGKPLWTTPVHQGGFMRIHSKNSQASSTPATDGNYIFTAFIVKDSLYVTAIDLQGKIVWQREAGPFASQHGYGSSPVVHGALVIVLGDSAKSGFLAALRRDTGEIVWRISRPGGPSYGTPVLADIAGQKQLLAHGQMSTTAYDPDSGEVLWSVRGPAKTTANTPGFAGDLVFASGGYPESGILAIRPNSQGSEEQVVWQTRDKLYVPSMLIHEGKLFAINDDGIGLCYDAGTGERLAKKRIGGNYSASLTVYGSHMLVPDEQGTMRVFEADENFTEVAEFQLEGGGFASPVFAGGKLFWRTTTHLYCLVP